MRVILAGPDAEELARVAYPAFAAAGLDVAAVVGTAGELADVAGAFPDGVAVVQAEMYAAPEEAAEGLKGLPCRVAVVLPAWWEGERDAFAALPNLMAGFTAPVPWPQVAAEVKARAGGGGPEVGAAPEVSLPPAEGPPPSVHAAEGGHPPSPPQPGPRLRANITPGGGGRAVALWSGPAGGTGRTALALALAACAAERGANPLLLALSEPAVSAYLGLPRVPNATAFFESGDLARAVQTVGWERGGEGRATLRVVLGPARPRDGAVEREQVGALLAAALAAGGAVVLDLPSLPPGGNVWSLEPLVRATDVVLVATPTATGVAAVVEGLATLRDLKAPGRVHLVVNHRAPKGTLSLRGFTQAVASLWGECPPVAAEVAYLPDLGMLLDQGELPDLPDLTAAVEELAERALGLPRPEPEGARRAEGAPAEERQSRPRRRRLGRLITVEVVD